MVIAHNIYAMNAQRQFKINTKSKAKNNEKLSSGYKINRSADDAAGLSISEKMRNQIRNLNQGINNTEDGIALIKTAEQALQESQNILKRMHELAVQAANDVNSIEDRQAIQNEIDSLYGEIDDIANKTQFNGRFPLNCKTVSGTSNVGTVDNNVNNYSLPVSFKEETAHITLGRNPVNVNGNYQPAYSSFDIKVVTYSGDGLPYKQGQRVELVDSVSFLNYGNGNWGWGTVAESYGGLNRCTPISDDNYDTTLDNFKIDDEGYVYYLPLGASESKYYIQLRDDEAGTEFGLLIRPNTKNEHCLNVHTNNSSSSSEESNIAGTSRELWIQSGANAGEGMYIATVDATTSGIGLSNVNVLSHQSASNSMGMIDNALKKVSEYRSQFGAQQNRLEYTIEHELNYSENLQNAESNLRDTDMAKEMLEYSKNSILEQAAQSMISQANQQNQGMLQLLQ